MGHVTGGPLTTHMVVPTATAPANAINETTAVCWESLESLPLIVVGEVNWREGAELISSAATAADKVAKIVQFETWTQDTIVEHYFIDEHPKTLVVSA